MKTVTHKGKVYQIGALYEFSDDDADSWVVSTLKDLDKTSGCPYRTGIVGWGRIREIQNPIVGTIEDAPVELEDGAAYNFLYGEISYFGIYHKEMDRFLIKSGHVMSEYCKNIVKLVPEVK